MKKLQLLLLLLFAITFVSYSQQKTAGTVQGKLADTATTQSLLDATISILRIKDSSTVTHTFSKADGSFILPNVPFDSYLLQVSFQGYAPVELPFSISVQQPNYNTGTIQLNLSSNQLETVVVKSSSTIVVKGDTTEFNAGSFKTKANATAEDLLKKIPGVEVDKDGSVKAQGEQVAKVMIDGKMFFGNDAKMATQNLPTDIIDKIQIIDAQSDQALFTGIDDGIQEKVINIVTKKDRRKGYFGKGNASAGNDGRYGVNANLNRFNGNRKISLIASANNTNQANYSINDILQIINSGGFNTFNGRFVDFTNIGQPGIARTYTGGLNYADVYGTKTQVSASYKYNNVNTINQANRLRETFVAGDSSLFNSNTRYGNNRNINHNANIEIDHKIDSLNSILVRSSFNRDRTNNYTETNSFLTRGKLVDQKDVRTINNSLTDGFNLDNNVLYRHRFARRGRTVSINFRQAISNSNTDRTAFNYTNDYTDSTLPIKKDTTNRISDITRETNNKSVRISYTEPITAKSNLELNYEYERNLSLSNQQTNSYNRNTGLYDLVDTVLSNDFKNLNISHRAGFNYRMHITKQWNYTVGLTMQKTEMSSDNKTKNSFLSQTFNNFFPTASLQYRKSRNANFKFNYRGRTRQPGITQLQDIVDNTNQLRIRRGNPFLKQEFSNNFDLRYTKIDAAKATNLIVRVRATTVNNKISNALTINTSQSNILVDNVVLEPFAQYSKPINVNGAYNINGYINYGFAFKPIKSNINLSTDFSHSRDVTVVNNVKGFTRNYSIGEKIRLTSNISEQFDLNFTSASTYNIALYSLREDQNGNYFTQVFAIEPTYNTKSGWVVATEFDYTKRTGQADGFNQSIPLWNASISKQIFKQKQGEIKLSVLDILNENKSLTRNVEENYIEDVHTNVLKRYFLLSFIYNFRKFGT